METCKNCGEMLLDFEIECCEGLCCDCFHEFIEELSQCGYEAAKRGEELSQKLNEHFERIKAQCMIQ